MKFKNFCYFLFALLVVLVLGCSQNEMEPNEPSETSSDYQAFHQIGDTIWNTINIPSDRTTIILDAESKFSFDLFSSYNINTDSEVQFIEVETLLEDQVTFLNTLEPGGNVFSGPILSNFKKGDTISTDITLNSNLDWFPQSTVHYGNTGWIKYHVFGLLQGELVHEMELGENYLVVKFGDLNEERLGWINLVYQDSFCYIKEAFHHMLPNQEIIVGEQ